mgnify:FL=1
MNYLTLFKNRRNLGLLAMLQVVRDTPGKTLGEVVDTLDSSFTFMSKTVALAIEKGYVTASHPKDDRRKKHLRITPKGIKQLETTNTHEN